MATVIRFPERDLRPLTAIVSEEVRALMGRRQVSQTALAQALDLHQTALSSRLRGRTEWKVAELDVLARFFGVHPAALFGGQWSPPRLPRLDSNQQPSGSPFPQVNPGDEPLADDELEAA